MSSGMPHGRFQDGIRTDSEVSQKRPFLREPDCGVSTLTTLTAQVDRVVRVVRLLGQAQPSCRVSYAPISPGGRRSKQPRGQTPVELHPSTAHPVQAASDAQGSH
jgi:hypothetical protein